MQNQAGLVSRERTRTEKTNRLEFTVGEVSVFAKNSTLPLGNRGNEQRIYKTKGLSETPERWNVRIC